MNTKHIIFYAAVAALTAIDMALMIGLFWSSLQITGSPLALGCVLCLSVLLPFGLQRLLPPQRRMLLSGLRRTLLLRMAGYGALLAVIGAASLHHLSGFVGVSLVVGTLGFFSTSALESLNTRLSQAGDLSSERAARWMQTAIQLGAFSGAAAGGWALERLGIEHLAQVLFIANLLLSALLLLPRLDTRPTAPSTQSARTGAGGASERVDRRILLWLCLALGMIGFHIGAFNTLTPVIYLQLNHWTSAQFGLASAVAGCGAFLAAVLPRRRVTGAAVAVWIMLMDAVLGFSSLAPVSIAAGFGIGYGINLLRIGLRKQLIDIARTPADADHIGSVSAFHYLLLQSAAPLLLSVLSTRPLLGPAGAPYLLPAVPLALLACLLASSRLSASAAAKMAKAGAVR
ncbi:hypothetical protein [Paludibacterium yongneupense]|uniref:hypothetical protein n=1 Tax=Paludibacterium yongneupense TaxID=400061 RepID=UPI0003F6BFB0|nr:hypothetical protein [Paludibacterium yongneupense]